MFAKEQRSSFPYWFAHWCAFQMTALNLGAWKFKYLFHDIEKPWLKLFMSYSKVKEYHRTHSKHHIEYLFSNLYKSFDFEAMMIDWECSRFTKEASPRPAYDEYIRKREKLRENYGESDPRVVRFELGCERVLKKLKLWK